LIIKLDAKRRVRVNRFNKSFFGYDKEEVRSYLDELEKKHQEFIRQKKNELNGLKDKLAHIENQNIEIQKQIDNKKSVREDFFEQLDQEITKIDQMVDAKRKESEYKTDLAIEKLIEKRNDLVKIQTYLKELYDQLSYLEENSSLIEKLHD